MNFKTLIFLFLSITLGCSKGVKLSKNEYSKIDTIVIVNYNGGLVLPHPPPPSKENINDKEIIEKYNLDLKKRFPNYNEKRDMKLPFKTNLLINEKLRYHPTIEWETKKIINNEPMKNLITLLNCEYQDEILEYQDSADCFHPEVGIILKSNKKIVTFYSISFECNQIYINWDQNNVDCINLAKLKQQLQN